MQNLYRLANITGLDTTNTQHTVAVKEALYDIEDVEVFIEYCRDNKDGIEYSTKTEKLDTLATRYKKIEAHSKLPHDLANSFSKELADKVEKARVFLKNELEVGNDKPFSRLTREGKKYFTDKEIKALGGLVTARHIIELSELGKLNDELVKLFMSAHTKKAKYISLTDGQKRIKKLLGGTK